MSAEIANRRNCQASSETVRRKPQTYTPLRKEHVQFFFFFFVSLQFRYKGGGNVLHDLARFDPTNSRNEEKKKEREKESNCANFARQNIICVSNIREEKTRRNFSRAISFLAYLWPAFVHTIRTNKLQYLSFICSVLQVANDYMNR